MRRVTTRLSVLLVASLLAAGPVVAQAPSNRVGASLEAGVRMSTLRDGTELLWGGAILLDVHPRISLGGSGWLLNRRSPIDVPSPGSDLEMTFGYGGLLAATGLWEDGGVSLDLRVLAGVGNAKVLVPVGGSEVNADNFGVLEPEVGLTLRLASMLDARITAAYLHAYGVDNLPQVLAADLSAYSLGLSAALVLR